jgi:hypothetical protein
MGRSRINIIAECLKPHNHSGARLTNNIPILVDFF